MNIKLKNGIRLAILIFSILTVLVGMAFGYGKLYEKVITIEKKINILDSTYGNHLSHIQADISSIKTDVEELKKNVNYFVRQFLLRGIER